MILLSALALSAAATGRIVELDCEMAVRGRTAAHQKWRAAIRLEIEGKRIASVLVDGPDPFTSYAAIRPGGAAVEPRELLHRSDRWTGHFQKNAIRLRRKGVDLVLEPKADPGATLPGFWTHMQMIENRPIEVNGTIACRPLAGTLAGNLGK
jgi:hypothetical protein